VHLQKRLDFTVVVLMS